LAVNVATTSTFDFWEPDSISGFQPLDIDLGAPRQVDTVVINAHSIHSSNVILWLSRSTDGINYTSYGGINRDSGANLGDTEDDSTICILIPSVSARYWRVAVQARGFSAPNSVPIIGNVLIGERLIFPAGVRPPYTPTHMAETVELLLSETMGGQFITNRPLRYGIETSISLNAVEYGFVEDQLMGFKKHYNDGRPFVWASSPRFVERDVAYVWRDSDAGTLSPTFDSNGNFMNLSMEVKGYKG
jgi:hypothetical protein